MTRALVVRAGALGDVLLLRRSVAALRRAGYGVTLLAPRASGSALVGQGGSEADPLLDWDSHECAGLLDEGAPLCARLIEALGGCALALVCSRNAAVAAQLRTAIADVISVDPQPPDGVHAARWYCSALPAGVADCEAEPPLLEPSAEEHRLAAQWRARLPAGFLALHPGSGSPAKNWPAARFAALARALSPDRPWLMVEGPADTAAAALLAREPGAVVARELPARVLGALLAHAGLYVGNDSGVTHLAAAFGAPTVALFGPTDPAHWAPVGPRVTVVRAPGGRMDQLEVEAAVGATRPARESG